MANAVDKEQIDMLKKWWDDYGRVITLAIAVGLLIGFGWKYWHQRKVQNKQTASIEYTQLQVAAIKHDNKLTLALAKRIKEAYKDTTYASFAALFAAQADVNEKKYEAALTELKWAMSTSKVAAVREVARLRAARVLLAEKKPDAALLLLKTVDEASYQPMNDLIKGEIYMAKGDKGKARSFFTSAKAEFQKAGVTNPFINILLTQ